MHWALLQWVDSAFPTGGYAHSSGLEAWAAMAPAGADFGAMVRAAIASYAQVSLPFARWAFREPHEFELLDARLDACTWGLHTNAASRSQGRALWFATSRSFTHLSLPELPADSPRHHAVVFGALARRFTDDETTLSSLAMFTYARGLLSAAVRLNVVGPFEAQRLLAELPSQLPTISAQIEEPASAAPYLDLVAEQHGRLHTRLFSS